MERGVHIYMYHGVSPTDILTRQYITLLTSFIGSLSLSRRLQPVESHTRGLSRAMSLNFSRVFPPSGAASSHMLARSDGDDSAATIMELYVEGNKGLYLGPLMMG